MFSNDVEIEKKKAKRERKKRKKKEAFLAQKKRYRQCCQIRNNNVISMRLILNIIF